MCSRVTFVQVCLRRRRRYSRQFSLLARAQATLLADESTAVSLCLTGWALASCANTPSLEKLSVPKGPVVGTAALLVVLGELTRQGKLDAGITFKLLAFLLIPMSMLEIVNPKAILDSYKVSELSPLSNSLFENFSFTKVSECELVLAGAVAGVGA